VRLKKGEAFFEAVSNPARPFVVVAGHREVTAIGTAFSVRYEPDHLAVMLVEGKVAVASTVPARGFSGLSGHESAGPRSSDDPENLGAGTVTLVPGQRLVFAGNRPPRLDTPRVEAVTAWRRGEVVLDKVTLADAVAEMNRYDRTRLVIDDPRVASLRVSGIYHTGDSAGFARAIGNIYDLTVSREGDRIHLRESFGTGTD